MIKTIGSSEFVQEFDEYNRSENFSIAGRHALFEYLEDLAEQTETPHELDVIALCCDFSEYEDLEELQRDYSDIESMEELENNTTVIKFGIGRFIIQGF